MNILVIGNGFDLAHELSTGYIDFLKWTVRQYYFFCCLKKQEAQITKSIEDISLKIPENVEGTDISYRVDHQEEIWNCINNNFWIEYFLPIYEDRKKNGKDGWIDFESEISKVIQSLDDDMNLSISTHFSLEDKIQRITNEFLNQEYIDWFAKRTYKELRDLLLDDLNKLTRALEVYLTEYVQKIDIKVTSPDIKDIVKQINPDTHTALPAKVISFNYTNTFEKLYDKGKSIEYDYIHGKADINNTIESNNMVLGIDEYLSDDRKNKDIEFIAFKKFYQRIFKGTGCKYKEWVEEIRKSKGLFKNSNGEWHNLYIFGHSLDVTDKDILRDLILNDNVHTTIYYHNKDAMGQQIANLVKVIGQDELIRRTGGSTRTIKFEPQKPMIPIDNQ